jgi:hypothetical protein
MDVENAENREYLPIRPVKLSHATRRSGMESRFG